MPEFGEGKCTCDWVPDGLTDLLSQPIHGWSVDHSIFLITEQIHLEFGESLLQSLALSKIDFIGQIVGELSIAGSWVVQRILFSGGNVFSNTHGEQKFHIRNELRKDPCNIMYRNYIINSVLPKSSFGAHARDKYSSYTTFSINASLSATADLLGLPGSTPRFQWKFLPPPLPLPQEYLEESPKNKHIRRWLQQFTTRILSEQICDSFLSNTLQWLHRLLFSRLR